LDEKHPFGSGPEYAAQRESQLLVLDPVGKARQMTDAEPAAGDGELDWRERAVSRSLTAARTRAEQRVQRFLDAAFALIDEKGSTDFTIQEVVERSKQSLRGFYEYFDGKDELVLALFEETVREAVIGIRAAVDAESEPLARLRAFAITLTQADRVRAALRPQTRLLRELVAAAVDAGVIHVADVRQAAALMQVTVMYSSFGNRLVERPERKLDAEATWEFCRRGLRG